MIQGLKLNKSKIQKTLKNHIKKTKLLHLDLSIFLWIHFVNRENNLK